MTATSDGNGGVTTTLEPVANEEVQELTMRPREGLGIRAA